MPDLDVADGSLAPLNTHGPEFLALVNQSSTHALTRGHLQRDLLFLRPVHMRPSSQKQMCSGTAIDRLKKTDMLVSIHATNVADMHDGSICVSRESAQLKSKDRDSVCVWSLPPTHCQFR